MAIKIFKFWMIIVLATEIDYFLKHLVFYFPTSEHFVAYDRCPHYVVAVIVFRLKGILEETVLFVIHLTAGI